MRVFEIDFDVSRYQVLLVDGSDEFAFPYLDTMAFLEGRLGNAWKPPPVYVDKPLLKRPDIFHLVGATGMVFGPRALAELERFALWVGELLPLPFESEVLQLLNVVEVINCLDEDSTVFDGGRATVLEFHAHRIAEAPIFRIPQNQSTQLFCHEGVAEPYWEFKAAVELAGLEGLTFTEVWNDQDGGFERKPRW